MNHHHHVSKINMRIHRKIHIKESDKLKRHTSLELLVHFVDFLEYFLLISPQPIELPRFFQDISKVRRRHRFPPPPRRKTTCSMQQLLLQSQLDSCFNSTSIISYGCYFTSCRIELIA